MKLDNASKECNDWCLRHCIYPKGDVREKIRTQLCPCPCHTPDYKELSEKDVERIITATDGYDPYPIVFALYEHYCGEKTWYGARINRKSAQWLCEALTVAWRHSLKKSP